MKIVDVEEMVEIFLHVLTYNVKNQVIQRDFVWSSEKISHHFNLVLLVVLHQHDELLKKPQPVTNTCANPRWRWFEVYFLDILRTSRTIKSYYWYAVFYTVELPWGIEQDLHKGECDSN